MAKFQIEYTYEATYRATVTVPDAEITQWLGNTGLHIGEIDDELVCEDGIWFELDPHSDEELYWGGNWDNFDITVIEDYVEPIDPENPAHPVIIGQLTFNDLEEMF